MARPQQIPKRPPLKDEEIQAASYVGSGEHKVERWWDGLPMARVGPDGHATRPKKQNTTICPKVSEAERAIATAWVREALRRGRYRYFEGDKTYPKHIWHMDAEGQFWFGFAVNQEQGTYKGWPISEAEKREAFD